MTKMGLMAAGIAFPLSGLAHVLTTVIMPTGTVTCSGSDEPVRDDKNEKYKKDSTLDVFMKVVVD